MKFNKQKLLAKYHSRNFLLLNLFLAIFALVVSVGIIAATGFSLKGIFVASAFFTAVSLCLNTRQLRLCVTTLSVPEILTDVLDAFKVETPSLFGENGFGYEFKSNTAVKGDKITAKIATMPVVGDYDAANGGFKAAAQNAEDLITDVPVTLDQFKVVVIRVKWLKQLESKIPLYKEAIRNYGAALGKYVVDTCLAQITAANFSNKIVVPLANVTLDTFDTSIRDQLNAQKTYNRGRFAMITPGMASKLGSDDRVRSSLFYNQKNGDKGYREWNNIGGLSRIQEYSDFPTTGNMIGFAADRRAIAVASRKIDFSNAAEELGVPKVMDAYEITDDESGLSMTGVAWQEAGTGDVLIGAGILFGVGAGKQGGANGVITDNAGVRIVTA